MEAELREDACYAAMDASSRAQLRFAAEDIAETFGTDEAAVLRFDHAARADRIQLFGLRLLLRLLCHSRRRGVPAFGRIRRTRYVEEKGQKASCVDRSRDVRYRVRFRGRDLPPRSPAFQMRRLAPCTLPTSAQCAIHKQKPLQPQGLLSNLIVRVFLHFTEFFGRSEERRVGKE